MASIPNPARVIAAAALLLACGGAAAAPALLPVREAAARRPGDAAPARLGEAVAVRGRVVAPAVRVLRQCEHVGIEQDGYGLMLEAEDARLRSLKPGDEVEAEGTVGARGGLPVLRVAAVRVLAAGQPPQPAALALHELQGFRHLGRLVVTSGRVLHVGENTAGPYLLIGQQDNPYKLFLSHSQEPGASFAGYAPGDMVRASGIASQYGAGPPFDRWFQLTIIRSGDVERTGRPLVLRPGLLVGILTAAALFGLVWWSRERRLRAQREALRRSHELGEEILGASSTQDILRKAAAVAPSIFGVTGVRLYLYNQGAGVLDKVPETENEAPVSIPLASPPAGVEAGAAACFHNRTALAVPDSSRSPFPKPERPGPPLPRAVLFVPMFVQGDPVGIMQLEHRGRVREFGPDEQALAQHLGNQIGVAVKLLDQRIVREQLFRTEKLAAVGRLITGVVNELQGPLASICNLAEVALADSRNRGEDAGQLEAISLKSHEASDMVSRLVSFASSQPVEARPVDLNRLLQKMAEFRDREWKARGIRVRSAMAEEPLPVLGSEGQLEQVFLDLILHAEQALQDASEKFIYLCTMRLARKVLVEIGYTGRRGEEPASAAATFGLDVCRSVIAGHGGELRAICRPEADPHFEIELPYASPERQIQRAGDGRRPPSSQPLTALVIEPDEAVERRLLALLTGRGYRVVPVHNSDSGLDLAHRIRFDVVFCSVRAPGLNWVELSESLQSHVGGFVLLSDGYDPELAADFEGDGRFVLAKPIDETRLDRTLQKVEFTRREPAAAS